MANPSGEFPVSFLHQCESTLPMIDEAYTDEQALLVDMFLNYNAPQPMDQVSINHHLVHSCVIVFTHNKSNTNQITRYFSNNPKSVVMHRNPFRLSSLSSKKIISKVEVLFKTCLFSVQSVVYKHIVWTQFGSVGVFSSLISTCFIILTIPSNAIVIEHVFYIPVPSHSISFHLNC